MRPQPSNQPVRVERGWVGVKTEGKDIRWLVLARAELAVAFGPGGWSYKHWLWIMAGQISYNAFMAVCRGGDQPRRGHLAAVEGKRGGERTWEEARNGGGFSLDYAGAARPGSGYKCELQYCLPYLSKSE